MISNFLKCLVIGLNSHIKINGKIKIHGGIPYFKTPKAGYISIGDNVVFNSDFKNANTALAYKCKLVTGYEGHISIGNNTMLNGVCIVSYNQVKIGKNCQIASCTLITDTDFHPIDSNERLKQVQGKSYSFASVGKGTIIIKDNVWIGWGVTILKNVTIGNNSIVAAGSVVLAGTYPDNCLIAGNPAKVVKTYSDRHI